METSFPEVITNSMRKDFVACERKFELHDVLHWKPKRTSVHLHAGGAFAKGIEVTRKAFYLEGKSASDSVVLGWQALADFYGSYENLDTDVKTVERMCGALDYYFTVWPLETDFLEPLEMGTNSRAIEFSFTHPLPIKHPITGNPILYYGRFDMLGKRKDDSSIWVVDEKTASQLGNSWIEGWALDSQFTSYCWGAKQYGYKVNGAIIRGISILKNGYGQAQSLQTRSDWEIQRWYEQLLRDIYRMIEAWRENYFGYNLGDSCKLYGGCMFRDVCKAKNHTLWLEDSFEQRPYEPWNGDK